MFILDPKVQGWLIILAGLALLLGRLYGGGVIAPAF